DDLGYGLANHINWDYYELVAGLSTLTGFGSYTGNILYLAHQPSNFYYGFQSGVGANNRNGNDGMSGWFYWTGWYNGQWRAGNGDLFTDKTCSTQQNLCNSSTTYLWRAVDSCGNATVATQTFTVVDTTPPVFDNCPESITIQCDDEVPPIPDDITATDNCGDVTITFLSGEDVVVVDDNCNSHITRIWMAEDNCENRSYCTQTIWITDTTPPVFVSVPADITYQCGDEILFDDAAATDNCHEVAITVSSEQVAGNCPQEYTLFRYFTATDSCGNYAYHTQTILVVDTIAPVFDEYIAEGEIECGNMEELENLTASDNCGEVSVELITEEILPGGCIGILHRVWQATDECGNTTYATQDFVISDNTPPVINNPEDQTVQCDQIPTQGEAEISDNCGYEVTSTFEEITVPGECSHNYTILWHWTATDLCNNTSEATTTITVIDTIAPYFSELPEDLTIECSDEIPAVVLPGAFDNCDEQVEVQVTENTSPGDCPQEYTIERIFHAYDDCGNEALASQFIHVVDTTAPSIDGQGEVVVECGEEIPYIEPSVSDNCSETTLSFADYSTITPWYFVSNGGDGSVDFNALPSQITIEGSDTGSNQDHWTAAATVATTVVINFDWNYSTNDVDGPSFDKFGYAINGSFTLISDNWGSNNQSGSYSVVVPAGSVFDFRIDAIDDALGDANVVISNITVEEAPEICPVVDYMIRQFVAVDECGNTNVFNQFIVTQDTTPPVFTGELEINLPCDDYSGIFVQVADSCSEVTVDYTDLEVSGGCQGRIIREYIATDACGNNSTFSQIITLTDTVAPVLDEQSADQTIECGNEYTEPWAIFSDNCDEEVSVTSASTEEMIDCATVITYTLTGTDNCGNTAIATVVYTIVDTTPPVVEAPYSNEFSCDEEIDYGQATASDICDEEVEVTFVDSTQAGNCPQSYVIHRTWVATDDCGNTGYGHTFYYVYDNEAPEFTVLPADVTVECDGEIPAPSSQAMDNCGEVTINVAESTEPGECTQSYYIYRTYTAVDECGNSSTASQIITVVDTIAPVFTGIYEINQPCDDYAGIYVQVSDNCDPEVNVTYSDLEVSGGCQGRIIREYVATDDCGNTSTFDQIITLTDVIPPVLVSEMPQDISSNCSEQIPVYDPVFTDNCDDEVSVTMTSTPSSEGCSQSLTQVWTASDNCGNTTSVSRVVTIVDTTPPQWESEGFENTFSCGIVVDVVPPVATDNCSSITYFPSSETISGDCPADVTQIYRWVAVDACGNISDTISFIIHYVDDEAPEFINIPVSGIYSCDEEVPSGSPTVTDNCSEFTVDMNEESIAGNCPQSYTIIRSWTATDVCGNTTEPVIVTYEVVDNEAPVFTTNPQDEYYECIPESWEPVAIAANDNCGEVTVDTDVNSEMDNCGNGVIVVTYTATDECGNSSSVSYSVYINDETSPIFSEYPESTQIECGAPIPDAPVITAIDNCNGEVEVTMEQFASGNTPPEGAEAECVLVTPARPANNPCGYPVDWAMALFSMPNTYKYYQVTAGSLVQVGNSLHLIATMTSAADSTSGFYVDAQFDNGMNWAQWSTQSFITGFKADCGGIAANHQSWIYYIMNNSNSTLTGFGNFNGSYMTLHHAPSNNYFGYQLGDGANNYNGANNGFGGWFVYSGIFFVNGEEVTPGSIAGAGDFALEIDCCADYTITRCWTAADCSGNVEQWCQTLTWADENDGDGPFQPLAPEVAQAATGKLQILSLYPNPTSGNVEVQIVSDVLNTVTLDVIDVTGREIAQVFTGNVQAKLVYKFSINAAEYRNGLYQVRLRSMNEMHTKHLSVIH
ncbi:MAG: T9SS type A sorting domain-containing protein, partial [Crocinitomicaceae bacterium]|nr:T9SS type A sorting domain-containing protein [Crocinitomicaceae bacterium]